MSHRQLIVAGFALAFVKLVSPAAVHAEDEAEDIGEITVTAPRVETPITQVPAAISAVDRDEIQLGTQQLGLDESLTRVPGIYLQNRYNFTQDLRIAIRGFGARSPFGIRGIRIFADDLPLTLPDGQGAVQAIDLASAERVEVIRGPSSSLYGAASGGVINVITEEGPPIPFAEARYSGGSYNTHRYNFKSGGEVGDFNYLFSLGRLSTDGYRDRGKADITLFNSKFRYDIDATSDITMVARAIDAPITGDPGGLTLDEVRANRRQAAPNNILFDAGQTADQQQVGFVYRNEIAPGHEIRLRNYYLWRDFEQYLPFGPSPFNPGADGIVGFKRFFVGGGAQYTYTGERNRFFVGFDVDNQTDDRQRHQNLEGVKGALRLDQEENVNSVGIYLQNEYQMTDTVAFTAGIRYDRIKFSVDDSFLVDGDDSGSLTFDNMSPMFGLRWSPLREVNFYGNISTAFETPTTAEFANPAAGGTAGGFNPNLGPQSAINYEIGVKGVVPQWWFLSYDVAFYQIDVEDELVPFQFAGDTRNFFENAGETRRRGIELALSANPLPGLRTTLAYTFSDFKFTDFVSQTRDPLTGDVVGQAVFDGNYIPGIPRHFGFLEIAYDHPSGFYGVWDTIFASSLYADNANDTRVSGYSVSNFRAGYRHSIGNLEISPFVGLNNVFDKEHFNNIRINAFGGRFYEPAPDRNFYAGLTLRYDFN